MSTYRFIRDLNIGSSLYLCAFGYVWQRFPAKVLGSLKVRDELPKDEQRPSLRGPGRYMLEDDPRPSCALPVTFGRYLPPGLWTGKNIY